jgi:hypothetical protein
MEVYVLIPGIPTIGISVNVNAEGVPPITIAVIIAPDGPVTCMNSLNVPLSCVTGLELLLQLHGSMAVNPIGIPVEPAVPWAPVKHAALMITVTGVLVLSHPAALVWLA